MELSRIRSVVKQAKTRPGNMQVPQKAGDVGYDLYVSVLRYDMNLFEKIVHAIITKLLLKPCHYFKFVWPWSSTVLRSGIHLELPVDIWARIEARSSTSKKKLIVLGGIIDSGYRGEYFTILGNFSLIPRVVYNGERYAQVVFYPAIRPSIEHVHQLESSARGASGFGSTGA